MGLLDKADENGKIIIENVIKTNHIMKDFKE